MADKPTIPQPPFDTDRDPGDESDVTEIAEQLRKAFTKKELDAIKRELDG